MSRFTLSVLLMVSLVMGMSQVEAARAKFSSASAPVHFNSEIASVVLNSANAPTAIESVTASDTELLYGPGYGPENTIDGDLNTRWAARGMGQWVQYELNPCRIVSFMRIAWQKGDRRVASFAIETSEDGASWIEVRRGESSGETSDFEPVSLLRQQHACFVRIVNFGNNLNAWNSITEVEIFGSHRADREDRDELLIDVFKGIRVSGWQVPYVPENVKDRDWDTYWAVRGAGQWIEFDLGDDGSNLHEVSIGWHKGDKRSYEFWIEVSDDRETWTLVYGGYSSGQTLDGETYRFAEVTTRFVRIIGFGNSQNNWTIITEVLLHFGL